MKITLKDTGLQVEIRSLSFDQAKKHVACEKKALGDMEAMHDLRQATIVEACGEEVFNQAAVSNADVVQLYTAVLRRTWGSEGDEKNS